MLSIAAVIPNIEVIRKAGPWEGASCSGVSADSRSVEKDHLFVAVRGLRADGHQFIDKAIQKGAKVIVVEDWPVISIPDTVVVLQVDDSRAALGVLATHFYGHPSRQLKLVGVTGTNGKTSVATLLYRLFFELGFKAGLISTVENRVGQNVEPAQFTTPDPVAINRLLAAMVEEGCDYVFMEVSSHALDQKRVWGLQFAGGIFTNISHDHLDYHKTFKAYIAAKKKLFDWLLADAFALVNADDRRSGVMVQNTPAKVYRFSLRTAADFKGKVVESTLEGMEMRINEQSFSSQLIGAFNAYNLLTVYGAAALLGQDPTEVLVALSIIQAPEGRFEQIQLKETPGILGVVDYCHTPDALEKVLHTIDQLNKGGRPIVTVVGCGGERDKSKRPKMARIACTYSDQVVITSDNPRGEHPEAIIADMLSGVPAHYHSKVLVISHRREAIRAAVKGVNDKGVILIAGKGHEKYQEINGVKHPFDDKQELVEAMKMYSIKT